MLNLYICRHPKYSQYGYWIVASPTEYDTKHYHPSNRMIWSDVEKRWVFVRDDNIYEFSKDLQNYLRAELCRHFPNGPDDVEIIAQIGTTESSTFGVIFQSHDDGGRYYGQTPPNATWADVHAAGGGGGGCDMSSEDAKRGYSGSPKDHLSDYMHRGD